ncbi:fimbrillin family protein [Niabella aurantiaca]|uniref:fimbrillin family protein n=1 Tax=Niabella aurantiaca TaxID=379900 RepID=UPI00037F2C11|nr:fimbrillin family protein [Niabella aurantiaca]
MNKRLINPVATLLYAILFLVACQKKDARAGIPGTGSVIRFTSAVDDKAVTKANGNTWDTNDSIGVFMNAAPGGANLAANKRYTTTGDGNFTAQGGNALSYPEDGSSVNFSAYYPYQPALAGSIYKINLANQSNPQVIDLMYSSNATNFSKASTANPSLNFEHQLARVTLTVQSGNGAALDGLDAVFQSLNTQADFNLASGSLSAGTAAADVPANVTISGATQTVTAILLPLADAAGKKVRFTLPSGSTYTWTFPAGAKFEKGKSYNYTITLQNATSSRLLMDMNYEDGMLNGGIPDIGVTNATAADAAYLVSPGATGNYAIAHKIVYGDSGYYSDGSWRSESATAAYKPNGRFAPGDVRRYEFSVYLKDWTPWVTEPIHETNIFQLKVSGNAETNSGVPLQMRVARNALRLRYVDNERVYNFLSDVRPYYNQWIHFRIDVKWTARTDLTGYIKTYMKLPGENNFKLVDERTNYGTFAGDPSIGNIGYIKWGLYGLQEGLTRIVYHDDIRIYKLN